MDLVTKKTFDTFKEKLMSQRMLTLPNLSKPFEIHCDACGDCLGAILLQDGHANAYESHQLHEQEGALGIYEKELLAGIHALCS